MTALVSVIIPNFNGEKTLGACLTAVAAQTYPAVEVIVVDDASTDRSREIAAGFDCHLVALPRNAGPAMARNQGIAASRGEVLFFLDADVALAPDAVATAVRILDEHPEYGSASGIYTTTPMFDDGPVERFQVLHAHYWRARHVGVVRAGYFSLGAFRREVIEEVGVFNGALPANFNEDTEYGYRIAERYQMFLTTEIRGNHDDDDRLRPIMRKYYRRVSSVVPLVLEQRDASPRTTETAHLPRELAAAGLAAGFAALAAFSAGLSALAGFVALAGLVPLFLLAALASLVGFAAADPAMLRFVRREAGLRFVPFFLAVHYLLSLTVATAGVVGLLRWAISPAFRRLYRSPALATAGR